MTIAIRIREDKYIEGEFILFQHNVTEDEFYQYADEDLNAEFIDGVLVIHSPASPEHKDIFGYLYTLLRYYLGKTNEGKVFGSRLAMRLSNTWSSEPDLLVILPKNYEKLSEGRLNGPADIIIEILSKATKEIDLNKKIPQYLKNGVKEVWVIDPLEKTIALLTGTHKLIFSDPNSKENIKSTVLKDFKLEICWLWNREEFNATKIINQYLT